MSEQSKDSGQQLENDRRDSPRVEMRLSVRRAGTSDTFEPREGNLSLGGFAWYGSALPVGTKVEVRILLPGAKEALLARGEVLHVGHGSRGSSAHVRFLELPVEAEMSIARYLDDVELAESRSRGGA
ncbi:PilZ domain-containing protein [Archangium sp.]|jgi:hypothetical protein|uniref:PilZ domain-containing protein n=1 Tax=Archangium sp. TaxID=1872627 RepID=UPI002EDBA27E